MWRTPDQRHAVIHAVLPRTERRPRLAGQCHMPWASVYWLEGREGQVVPLKESGFRPNLFAVNLNRRRSNILGIIIGSTVMIVPWPGKALESGGTAAYTLPLVLICVGALAGGVALAR